jgi:CBS domain-containing protein
MKIRDLLKVKDFKYRIVVTAAPNETISAAIQKLVEHDRGSLAVCNDKGELVGIITERDIVRKCFARSDAFANIKVKDVMSKQVAIGSLENDLDYAISVMKHKRIRHLPIVDGQKFVGMISMRDLLGVQLEETQAEIRYAGLLPRRTRFRRPGLV